MSILPRGGRVRSLAVVDSGPLIAAANRRDPHHEVCVALLENSPDHLVIPALCVAEVTYFLGSRWGAGAEARFLRGLASWDVEAPRPDDWARIAELVKQYQSLPLGGTDASLIALAERLAAVRILTLDRRHFTRVRPRHCSRFELLPE